MQQTTANIDTKRCIGVQAEKLGVLFVNSNSFKTYVAKKLLFKNAFIVNF